MFKFNYEELVELLPTNMEYKKPGRAKSQSKRDLNSLGLMKFSSASINAEPPLFRGISEEPQRRNSSLSQLHVAKSDNISQMSDMLVPEHD